MAAAMQLQQPRPPNRAGFEIAIICALPIESDAVEALLDVDYEADGFSYGKAAGDENAYTVGRMANQHVVIAHMPGIGKVNAATIVANLRFSFNEIKLGLVVGICGGAPKTPDGKNIYLGDVIIGTSVIQVDFGRQYPNGFVRRSSVQNDIVQTSAETRSLLRKLSNRSARNRLTERAFEFVNDVCGKFHEYRYPGASKDILHPPELRHKHWNRGCPTCEGGQHEDENMCELALKSSCVELGCPDSSGMVRTRSAAEDAGASTDQPGRPYVHFGTIACSDRVMRSAIHRDRIALQEGAIGFEMESAGAWNQVPTIVIKSVCDYADSHKDKEWQLFAALTAAACTKALLHERRNNGSFLDGHGVQIPSRPHVAEYPVHWGVRRPRNTLFIGREDILSDLETIISENMAKPTIQETCAIAITGMGGQGKSEISLQLAHRAQRQFWGIFWVDVSTPSQAENGFLNIATQLKERVSTWEDARQVLSNTRKPWLLILDNADDPDTDYQPYFPTGLWGVVILTSRNSECQQYATTKWIDLKELSEVEARELLFRVARVAAKDQERFEKDADKVTSLLQSHALALIQAGSYIARGHCTLKQYPEVFEKQKKRLLQYRPSQAQSRYGDVFATLEASAEALNSMHTEAATDALELLSILGFFGPDRFPAALFSEAWRSNQSISGHEPLYSELMVLTQWHTFRLPSFIRDIGGEWDAFRMVEAIRLLQAFSIVRSNTKSDSIYISMHPLPHVWAKERLEPQHQHDAWIMASCLAASPALDGAFWEDYTDPIRPHIEALTAWPMQFMFSKQLVLMVARILARLVEILNYVYADEIGFNLVDRLISHLGLSETVVSPEWVQIYVLKGTNLMRSHVLEGACEIFEQVSQIYEEEWESRNEGIFTLMTVRRRQAHAYVSENRAADAIPLLESIVKSDEQDFDEDDGYRNISLTELAKAYIETEQYERAVTILERVVRFREESLPPDHPTRLAAQHELARAYTELSQYDKAIPLFEYIIRTDERTRPQETASRLVWKHVLSRAYLGNREYDKAIATLEYVIRTRAPTVPPDHAYQRASKFVLAESYAGIKKYETAVAILEEVVKMDRSRLKEHDIERMYSEYSLSENYWALGRHKIALEMMKRLLEVAREHMDKDYGFRRSIEDAFDYMEDYTPQGEDDAESVKSVE